MTGKERALCAISGQKTDRHSVMPSIDICYAARLAGFRVDECFVNPTLHAQALTNALNRHPEIDGVYINLCLTPRTFIKVDEQSYLDSGGMLWNVPYDDIGTVRSREIESLNDHRLLTENPLMDGIIDTFLQIPDSIKDRYLIIPGLTGPFSHLVFMIGLEKVLLMAYDEPDKLKQALAYRTILAMEWAEQLSKIGAQVVWIGEGAASSSIISPSMYREFVMPYAKKVVDRLKELGLLSIMHVCGDINKSADVITQTGTDAIDIDYMVPMNHVAEAAKRKICVKGNLNPVLLLEESPANIEAICKKIIATSPKPMILSTGCLVARDTPPKNIEAMVSAAKNFDEYT